MIFIEEGIFSKEQITLLKNDYLQRNNKYKNFDYFIVGHKTKLSEDFFHNLNSEKSIILSLTTGITHIDSGVWNNPNRRIETLKNPIFKEFLESTHATAELALYHIYALLRGISQIKSTSSIHEYLENRPKGRELSVLSCGIIGNGRIGSRISSYLSGMCSQLFSYDLVDISKKVCNTIIVNSIEELVKNSDLIILSANYQIGSPPVLDKEFFKAINKPKYIVNISRGELIDFNELEYAILSGKVIGYATDVFAQENSNNIRDYDRLIKMQLSSYNISLTPHIGGNTEDAHNKLFLIANKFLDNF